MRSIRLKLFLLSLSILFACSVTLMLALRAKTTQTNHRYCPDNQGENSKSELLTQASTFGQEWPRFRGPNGQGLSNARTIPTRWTAEDYNWKVCLAGDGHSSPVVWGDKVFITSVGRRGKTGFVQAFRISDGKMLWEKEYRLKSRRLSSLASCASATPSVDNKRIYALWHLEDVSMLVALDHGGNEMWNKSFVGKQTLHGAGSSPVVYRDIVVFTHEQGNDPGAIKSTWVAVDSTTGTTRWTIERDSNKFVSHSTPCLYPCNAEAKQQASELVFTSCAHGMTGVDPLKGTINWEVKSAFPNRTVSSPVIAGELVVGTCGEKGSGKHLIAVKPPTKGSGLKAEVVYKVEGRAIPFVSTPVVKDGFLFTFHDGGKVSCLDVKTGNQLWCERPAGRFYGSPVCVADRIYCITHNGQVVVIKAADEYELLAVNDLDEKSYSTPAVSGERMFLRTYSHLICIGGSRK